MARRSRQGKGDNGKLLRIHRQVERSLRGPSLGEIVKKNLIRIGNIAGTLEMVMKRQLILAVRLREHDILTDEDLDELGIEKTPEKAGGDDAAE